MGVTVEISNVGVEITHPAKDKQIFLAPEAWQKLVALKSQIEERFSSGKDQQWMLDEVRDIRAHVNIFKDNIYLHIRHWWQNKPTKQGVCLTQHEWSEIKSHFVQNAEVTMGITVLKKLLTKKLRAIIKENCEGCEQDYPSQTDHACLMDGENQATAFFQDAFAQIAPTEFIATLAKEAVKEKVILEQPHCTFKHIKKGFMATIQQEILADFK